MVTILHLLRVCSLLAEGKGPDVKAVLHKCLGRFKPRGKGVNFCKQIEESFLSTHFSVGTMTTFY